MYPKILKDPKVGEEASRLFADAQELLDEIVRTRALHPKAVIGFYPANSVGDDIEVYADEDRRAVRTVFHSLRQQAAKVQDKPFYALSDLVAPKASGVADYIGGFAVTAGAGDPGAGAAL